MTVPRGVKKEAYSTRTSPARRIELAFDPDAAIRGVVASAPATPRWLLFAMALGEDGDDVVETHVRTRLRQRGPAGCAHPPTDSGWVGGTGCHECDAQLAVEALNCFDDGAGDLFGRAFSWGVLRGDVDERRTAWGASAAADPTRN